MKIKDGATFPHPVLQKHSDDYLSGSFDVEYRVDVKERTIQCTVRLDEPHIAALINDKLAKIGVFISCKNTYYQEFIDLDNVPEPQAITYKPEAFTGAVLLRAVICSTQHIKDYAPDILHEELAATPWSFNPGELLAFSPENKFRVGNAKLRPTETIFMFSEMADMPEGEIKLNLEEDKVAIVVNPKTHKKFSEMRATTAGKHILLSSVYQPVIMEMFFQLSQDHEQYEDKAWFTIFQDKCTHLGINIENTSPLEGVQKILKQPLLGLLEDKELTK